MTLKIKTGVSDEIISGVQNCYETYDSWEDRDRDRVATALRHSDEHIYALDTQVDEVVASARVLTDYSYYGVIYDVIVNKAYRDEGVGKRVVRSVVQHPPLTDVDQVTLVARDGLIPFYRQCGFKRHPMEIEVDGETESFNRMVLDETPTEDETFSGTADYELSDVNS